MFTQEVRTCETTSFLPDEALLERDPGREASSELALTPPAQRSRLQRLLDDVAGYWRERHGMGDSELAAFGVETGDDSGEKEAVSTGNARSIQVKDDGPAGIALNPISTTAETPPLLGKSLKQYRVTSLLGRGGMGLVYRAFDEKLQRQVAIKLLAPDVIQNPERRKRFLLEARAAARITHPAIAQVYDVDEQDELIFIAMELVEGSSIRDLVASRGLDLLGAIDVAQQVAGGLAKAHQAGIVHRDIKSANVMMTPDGHAKILDFGLAKLLDTDASTIAGEGDARLATIEQTQTGTIKGTPAYMSPEQVKGLPVDARSDIFSLGVMLFEMATGRAPFQRGTMLETIHAVVYEEPVPPETGGVRLPDELRRIIERCLRKNPDDRYATALELMEDLRVARRNTESGHSPAIPWRERLGDAIDQVGRLRPAQLTWVAIAVLALGVAIYALLNNVSLGGFAFFLVIGAIIYRRVRHQPRRQLEWLVGKISKVPEVKLISVRDRNLIVVVDRLAGQLYERINRHVNDSNAKLYFGEPVTLTIRHDLPPEELRRLLQDSGVQFLRDSADAG